jgi:hypothetical protein
MKTAKLRSALISTLCLFVVLPLFSQRIKPQTRYINHTEVGTLLGRVKFNNGTAENAIENRFSITAQTFNGIRLTPRLATGLTVGMDWYKTALISPIAAGARFDLNKARLASRRPARLFASLDAGYGTTWLHQDADGYRTKGGWMVNPGIGLKYGSPAGAVFTLSLSYRRQEVSVGKPLRWQEISRHEERVYNRLALKMGMAF